MKIKTALVTIFSFGILLIPAYANAEVPILKNVCEGAGSDSSVCDDYKSGKNNNPLYGPSGPNSPGGIITIVVNLLSLVVGIAAVIGIIMAGIRYITSGSNPEEANKARELVIYGLVGLALAVVAQVLVRTVLFNILV